MSNDFSKINYFDLRLEAQRNKLPALIGRAQEQQRLTRIVSKGMQNNALVVGLSGTGKTTLLKGWAAAAAAHPALASFHLVELDTASLQRISSLQAAALARYQEAFARLEGSIIVIDGFGGLIFNQPSALTNWAHLLRPLLADGRCRFVLSLDQREYDFLAKEQPALLQQFEIVKVATQPEAEINRILGIAAERYQAAHGARVPEETIETITNYVRKFPILGQLPKAGITVLDECVAECRAAQAGRKQSPIRRLFPEKFTAAPEVTKDMVSRIVSEKTGIPASKLNQDEKEKLKNLHATITKGIIGQDVPLKSICSVIQRARLGLKNSRRPLGSFLLLGPSGVGKTETAKLLAHELYGSDSSFLRIDMSEFTEAHTVQRLVGSPPGYLGSDAGGQLTNHLKNNPYSLVLLDEIEKAHPKIFDIFLQLLDDGRLTSGTGETVDATQCTVLATSNLGVEQIITHFQGGRDIHSPEFQKAFLTPILIKHFRMEFLNRFDSLVVYKPLTPEDLTSIALLEIRKIEQRVKQHNITFNISREALERKVAQLADPRFGARPVKRYIEELCEGLIAEKLLQ